MLEVIFADKKIFLKKHTQSISSPSYTLYILTYFNVGNRNLRSKPSLFPPSPRGKKKRKEGGEKNHREGQWNVKFRQWAKRGGRGGWKNRGKVEESTVHFIDAIKTNIIRRRRKRGRNAIDRTRELAPTHQTRLFFTRSGFLRTTGHLRELLPSALARSQRTPPRHSTQRPYVLSRFWLS